MDIRDFNSVVHHQLETCEKMLVKKAEEYAPGADRLHNFRKGANGTGKTMEQVLAGFMLKHSISIDDMIESGETYDIDLWSEKITDNINYLILLKAIVVNGELNNSGTSLPFTNSEF